MSRFVVVPQWQGSPSPRAMALIDGADAIAGDLPRSACTRVDVPLEAGDEIGTGIHRASSLLRIRRETLGSLAGSEDAPSIVIGGDAAVSVWALDHLTRDGAGGLGVAWFGARASMHSPATSPDGAFEGMALRAVTGDLDSDLALPEGRISSIALAGAREYDDEEAEAMAARGVADVAVDAVTGAPSSVADALASSGARRVFVHVSLDVLDPADVAGLSSPVPFGLAPQALVEAIGALRARFELAGAAITGFAPSSPSAAVDDMGTILRLVSALTKASA